MCGAGLIWTPEVIEVEGAVGFVTELAISKIAKHISAETVKRLINNGVVEAPVVVPMVATETARSDTADEEPLRCKDCGKIVDKHFAVDTPNGDIYCEDCTYWCDYCEEFHPVSGGECVDAARQFKNLGFAQYLKTLDEVRGLQSLLETATETLKRLSADLGL